MNKDLSSTIYFQVFCSDSVLLNGKSNNHHAIIFEPYVYKSLKLPATMPLVFSMGYKFDPTDKDRLVLSMYDPHDELIAIVPLGTILYNDLSKQPLNETSSGTLTMQSETDIVLESSGHYKCVTTLDEEILYTAYFEVKDKNMKL